jgi:hypothetical protein
LTGCELINRSNNLLGLFFSPKLSESSFSAIKRTWNQNGRSFKNYETIEKLSLAQQQGALETDNSSLAYLTNFASG